MFTSEVSSTQGTREGIRESRERAERCPSVLNTLYRPVSLIGQFGVSLLGSAQMIGLFLSRCCKAPSQVGSICPSSKYLVNVIVMHALPADKNKDERGRHILEVGPGTGPITEKIVEKLELNDRLDLVEFDPTFAELLIKRYQNDTRIHVHTGCFIEWAKKRQTNKAAARYDVVISGLPLNIFSVKQAKESLDALKAVTSLEGSITYFEYPEIAKIKKLFLLMICAKDAYKKAEQIENAKKNFCIGFKCSTERVCMNPPPARVVHIQLQRSLFVRS